MRGWASRAGFRVSGFEFGVSDVGVQLWGVASLPEEGEKVVQP